MPKYDIGPTIGIQGEREYRDALKAIEQGQKTMASEMQKVAAQFAGNEKSIEALTAKHDVLQRTLYGEREKVEKLREAVKHATEAYGEGDKRTQAYQAQLNRAEAAEYKLEKQLADTTNALKKQGQEVDTDEKAMADFGEQTKEAAEKSGGLGGQLDQLASKFGINLPSGITNSLNNLSGFSAKSVAAVTAIGGLVTALVKVEQKFMDLAKAQASAADELATTSQITGISTKALQEYAYAAEFVDVSVDTITGAQTKLIRSMDAARDGTEKNIEAFRKLGIEYQNADGTLRNADDVFWETIDALGRMQSGTERDAAAMDLLGKSAQDLNPLIKAGSDQMRAYAKEAENVGYILGEKDVEALTTLDDAQQRMTKTNEALQKQIAAQFAPSATTALEKLTDVIQVLGKAVVDSGAAEAFGFILESVVDIITPLGDLDAAGNTLRTTFEGVAYVLAGVADALQFIVGAAKVLGSMVVMGKGSWLSEGLAQSATAMGYSINGQSNYTQRLDDRLQQRQAERSGNSTYYNGQFYGNSDAALYARWLDEGVGMSFDYWKQTIGRNAGGTSNWRGGLTWVGESGPEIVDLPTGSQIYSAQESRELAGDTNITLVMPGGVREMAQAVELLKAQRADTRRGGKVRR